MRKIPTLFVRDQTTHLVTDNVTPGCEWVITGEGTPTRKWDGTACLWQHGGLWKRYELKKGKPVPEGFINAQPEPDPLTNDWPGWVPVGDGPEDRWHREALEDMERRGMTLVDGTYELVGPKIQGNPEHLEVHTLVMHGVDVLQGQVPVDYEGLRRYLAHHDIEGIVWHHPDGRMAKLKGKDFWKRGKGAPIWMNETAARLTMQAAIDAGYPDVEMRPDPHQDGCYLVIVRLNAASGLGMSTRVAKTADEWKREVEQTFAVSAEVTRRDLQRAAVTGETPWYLLEGGTPPESWTREDMGRRVRQVWVAYCQEIGDTKPSHIAPWEELSETDQEVDRRIGAALFDAGYRAAYSGREYPDRLPSLVNPYLSPEFRRRLEEGESGPTEAPETDPPAEK